VGDEDGTIGSARKNKNDNYLIRSYKMNKYNTVLFAGHDRDLSWSTYMYEYVHALRKLMINFNTSKRFTCI